MVYNIYEEYGMDNNFIILDFGKVYIVWENDERKFYKEDNGRFVSLSFDEFKIVSSLFNKSKHDNYYSERINSILSNNNDIDNKEFVINFLNFLESIIPENCRDNFYRNLETVKIKLNFDTDFLNSQTNESSFLKVGNYNVKYNIFHMEQSYLKRLWEIAQKNSNSEDFFWKEVCLDILHELSHMASSRYDSDTNISYCGFDKYPYTKQSDGNRGITEGMTEVIAMTGVPNTIEISSGYYIEASFINQLMQILGRDVIIESYFSNKGTIELEKELDKYQSDFLNSKLLFRRIEDNFYLKDFDGKQGLLAGIQSDLIEYYGNKLLYCIRNGLMSIDEVNQSLYVYESVLITSQKIKLMMKNADNYIGLGDSVEKFYSVRKKINEELLLFSNKCITK